MVGAQAVEGNSRRTSNSLELFKPFQVRWGLAGDGAGEESEAHIRTFLRMAQPLHQQVFGGCCEHSQFIPWALVCVSLIRRTRPDGLLGLQSHCGGLPGSGHTVEETVSPCSRSRPRAKESGPLCLRDGIWVASPRTRQSLSPLWCGVGNSLLSQKLVRERKETRTNWTFNTQYRSIQMEAVTFRFTSSSLCRGNMGVGISHWPEGRGASRAIQAQRAMSSHPASEPPAEATGGKTDT